MTIYRFSGIPLEAQCRLRQARELADKGNNLAALAYFRQAMVVAPGFSAALREAGDCLCRLGRSNEAAVYYARAKKTALPSPTRPAMENRQTAVIR